MKRSVAIASQEAKHEDFSKVGITALRLLRSEWTKLWSVRSLWITLTVGFTLTIGLGIYLILDGEMLTSDEAQGFPFGWTAIYPVGMLVIVILGILTMATEYGTGSIRTTMVAAPRRTGILLAKAALLTAVTAILAVFTTVLLYTVLQVADTVPSARGLSLLHPDMFWGALGGTLIFPYGALLGLLMGGLLRNSAAAICLYFGAFQMGPQLLPVFLPDSWSNLLDYMPLTALDVMRSGGIATEPYGAGISIIVLLTWLIALGGLTWWLLKTRDV